MDITTDFGSVILGSSPGGRTALKKTGPAACFLAVRGGAMFRLFLMPKRASPGRKRLLELERSEQL